MNVSLTRAKYALYVVAHFDSLEVCICFFIWPNKKISVFWVTDLKILGRVGTHFF